MKLFLLGATPSFNVPQCDTLEAKLAATGGNTGNQLIAYGLLHPLVYEHVEWDYRKGPDYVDEKFDMILIAAANFLFPGFDFGGMADFIAKTKLPVAVVGLGAQSKDYSPKIELQPGTERLMRVIAERAPCIGVRGPFTAQVLHEMGIDNVQIVGCPSYYMNGENQQFADMKRLSEHPKIAVNASRDVLSHAFDREKLFSVISGLVAEAMRYNGVFIAQTEKEEMILAENPNTPEATAALDRFAAFFDKPISDMSSLREWAALHHRVYWSIEKWLEDMRALDFVTGTRIHGALAALSVGTPAFVLCHDTRTKEMSEFLGVPHAHICDIERIDIRELYDRVDVNAFASRRQQLLPHYRTFMNINGLEYKY